MGVTFEGTEGTFFVSRGKLAGKPVDELKEKPLPEDLLKQLYKGKTPVGKGMPSRKTCDSSKRPSPFLSVSTTILPPGWPWSSSPRG